MEGKSVFVELKEAETLDHLLTRGGLTSFSDLLGSHCEVYGYIETAGGYIAHNRSAEQIKSLTEHPTVEKVYEGSIPVERIRSYGDGGLQAGATVWNAKFGEKGYVKDKLVDATLLR